jgi:8-amino-7-oxononanoate synthase
VRGFDEWLQAELDALDAADRLRACAPLAGPSRVRPDPQVPTLLSFCSNDYLGMAGHPALSAAAIAAAKEEGFGAAASRLVAGDLPSHRALEAAVAAFTRRPAALAFPSGYQANQGVLSALAGSGDLIASDASNHASLIDGCRLSRAEVRIYAHADADAARRALASGTYRRRFLVTESLFSMTGDVAPLADLAAAAGEHDAVLVVDEAHALGVIGPGGRGACAAAGVVPDVLIGTLGKAFGAAGGFAAGHPTLRAFLVNRARTFIYTTGLPPPVAAAARASVDLVAGPEGDARRAAVFALVDRLAQALGRASRPPAGPIFPIVLGSDARALAVSSALRARGIFVPAIRPPTVPEGSARLRVTLSAAHQPSDVDALAAALREVAP